MPTSRKWNLNVIDLGPDGKGDMQPPCLLRHQIQRIASGFIIMLHFEHFFLVKIKHVNGFISLLLQSVQMGSIFLVLSEYIFLASSHNERNQSEFTQQNVAGAGFLL